MGADQATALLSSLKTLFPQIPTFRREIEARVALNRWLPWWVGRCRRCLTPRTRAGPTSR